MENNSKPAFFLIKSAILNDEDIILVIEKESLNQAIKFAHEKNLILYTPSEIKAMENIDPEGLRALHLAKRKLGAKIIMSFQEGSSEQK